MCLLDIRGEITDLTEHHGFIYSTELNNEKKIYFSKKDCYSGASVEDKVKFDVIYYSNTNKLNAFNVVKESSNSQTATATSISQSATSKSQKSSFGISRQPRGPKSNGSRGFSKKSN